MNSRIQISYQEEKKKKTCEMHVPFQVRLKTKKRNFEEMSCIIMLKYIKNFVLDRMCFYKQNGKGFQTLKETKKCPVKIQFILVINTVKTSSVLAHFHIKEKLSTCMECDETFTSTAFLQCYGQIHLGEKPVYVSLVVIPSMFMVLIDLIKGTENRYSMCSISM